MVRFLAVVALMVSTLSSSILAFPNHPGTCVNTGMIAGGESPHGAVASTDLTYSISVKSNGTDYSVTINGNGTFNGMLLYAVDTSNNNTRFGSFIKPPTGLAPYTVCGGVNPTSNTLGHNAETPKKLPLTLTWSAAKYNASTWTASFNGILMSSNPQKWYIFHNISITGSNATTTTTLPSGTNVTGAANSTNVPTDTGNGTSTSTSTPTSSAIQIPASLGLSVLLSALAALMI